MLYFVFWPICFPELILYIAVGCCTSFSSCDDQSCVWELGWAAEDFHILNNFLWLNNLCIFYIFFKNSRMRRCCPSAGCVSCLSWVWGRTSTPLRSSWRKVPTISPVTCFGVNPMRPVWVRRCRLPAWWVTWNTHHETKLHKIFCLSLSGKIIWHSCGIQCWVLSLSP